MMNTDGTGGTGSTDDQQMVSVNDRENYIARLTTYLGGNRDLAMRLDEAAYSRSGGKLLFYRRQLQAYVQQRNQQMQQQQQQQQQQTMMNTQSQQQTMMNTQSQQQMYMQPQQQQQQQQQQPPPPQPSYTTQVPQRSSSPSVMNIKQESQTSLSNMQPRLSNQNFPTQQQQIKQELMAPIIQQQQQQQQQQIKQELMAPLIQQQHQQQQQQQPGLQVQQMRTQQQPLPPPPTQYMQLQQQQQQQMSNVPPQPATATPQQRTLAQHLQQVRQQSHLSQPQDSLNPSQLQQQQQQQQQPTNSSVPSQPSSSSSQDEILQHLLSSPNPPKQPSTVAQNAVQARLRTMNRSIRQPVPTAQPVQLQQQASPMASGSDPMMSASSSGAIPSPHSHPGMMQQQQQASLGSSVQSPLARYMMAQSPQSSAYRPQMSPMNMMNYANSPTPMIDDEIQFLLKFFTDRIQYVLRIIARCQQENQLDKIPKYRQLHDQISAFIRNPISEHLMVARRLKEHIDRVLGPILLPPTNEVSTMVSSNTNNTRQLTNGIFEQCQRTISDYLSKDSALKYNIAKRFLEPLSEVLNGVPHKNIRLDIESKPVIESYQSSTNNHSLTRLTNIIESEFAHLSSDTYSYELKPMYDKISPSPSILKNKDSIINDYELTCRLIELNMPLVPSLKMKLTIQYPNESPEILSLASTAMNVIPTKLEYSDGNILFETISRNFVYFLFKLPTQHTITDVLDIWRTAIRNASFSQNQSEK